ncbi:MAG: NADPH:quinone reductase [Acidobacteria bacterium]|nr:NADPH:quinone reductase [Acidobacteriota bacterium]
MKAIVVREYGDPEVMKIEETPIPEVGVSDVLVRIKAAGVNPVDTYVRQGVHASAPALPFTPGKDAAGIVEAVGENVQKVKAGDRVYLAGSLTGTYAEYSICTGDQVWKLPEKTTFEKGAGIFVPYATAFRALIQKAAAKRGETVLIHGASGAVGVAAIQWAKNAGMKVIGTASSESGKKLVIEEGADLVFDHSDENYLTAINEATNGNGVNVILEMLANVNLQKDFEVLAKFGRIVVIGNRGSLDFNPRLAMGKDAAILGMSLFNASEEDFRKIHSEIYSGLTAGYLDPVVGKSFALSEAVTAHHEVIENKAFGKIVLVPDDVL